MEALAKKETPGRNLKPKFQNWILEMSARGAIFYVSHSGGKDSQTMFLKIAELVPAAQIVVIHAHLPEVEWKGTRHQIKLTTQDYAYLECQASKTFFEMVDRRQMWPSAGCRQCTSDLKRDPIHKAIRHDMKARGKHLAVITIGIRAEESPHRARAKTIRPCTRMNKAGREVWEILPIHDYLLEEVWATIENAGERPHWAYSEGMSRLSCCFCIMASKADLTTSARVNPELYRRYVMKEREINHTMRHGVTLEEITGIPITERSTNEQHCNSN